MAKPHVHAESCARKWGGKMEDYLEIHSFLDSTKSSFPDNRHRFGAHQSWFVGTILEKVFGYSITNSNGRIVSVRDVGESHCLEDFAGKFIPSLEDFVTYLDCSKCPPSNMRLFAYQQATLDAIEYGGKIEDYLEIHETIDSVRSCASPASDYATHNSWFIGPDGPIGRIFGKSIGDVPVTKIAENHIIREYGKVLIPQDIIQHMEFADWMQNGQGHPPSHAKIHERRVAKARKLINGNAKTDE